MAEGNQTQFHQCLEAVADTQHQAIPLAQQIFHFLGNQGVAEEAGNELAAAVGFVAAGEAAGDHDDLAFPDGLGKGLDGFFNLGSVAVAYHKHLRQGAGPFKDPGSVVLTVGAGENRNQHPRFRHLNGGRRTAGFIKLVADGIDPAGRRFGLYRVYRLQLLFIRLFHAGQVEHQQLEFRRHDAVFADYGTHDFRAFQFGEVGRQLQHKSAVHRVKQQGGIQALVQFHAHGVAGTHFVQRFGYAAGGQGKGGADAAILDPAFHQIQNPQHVLKVRLAVFLVFGEDDGDLVPDLFQFLADNLVGIRHAHGKGNQSGRHADVLKGAAHGVLAADGGDAQFDLGFVRAQQSSHRLSPAGGIVLGAFKVFLEGEPALFPAAAYADHFRHGFYYGIHSAQEGALFAEVGVVAPAHDGAGIGFSVEHRDLGHHGLGGGSLTVAAVGHQYRAGADGGVKPFHQSPLGAKIQIPQVFLPVGSGAGVVVHRFHRLGGNVNVGVFFRSVAV